MNPTEARERFRTVIGNQSAIAPDIPLDEVKQKFREAAAELDKKIGLEGPEYGVWAAALFFIATIIGTGRTRSWLVPLMTSLVSFSGKTIDMVLGMFAHKPKQKKPQKSRRAKNTPS